MHVHPRRAQAGASMVTSRMLGAFRDDPSTRREFLAMISPRSCQSLEAYPAKKGKSRFFEKSGAKTFYAGPWAVSPTPWPRLAKFFASFCSQKEAFLFTYLPKLPPPHFTVKHPHAVSHVPIRGRLILHSHILRPAAALAALGILSGCGIGHQTLGLGNDENASLGQGNVAPSVFGYAVADEPQAALVGRKF